MLHRCLVKIMTLWIACHSLAWSQSAAMLHTKQSQPPSVQKSATFVNSLEKRFVSYVKHTVDNLRYSVYQFGGSHFDVLRGVYIVDCSSYVDHLLRTIFPRAYSTLVRSSGTSTPNSQNYYQFFTKLPNHPTSHSQTKTWNKVNKVEDLQPGDILVFRYKSGRHASSGGHVMVVMKKPSHHGNAFHVQVADSAATGHSHDTRPPHVSGIGIGTLMLKVGNRTGQPAAYAWKTGAGWKNNVNIAMARPINVS